MRWLLALCLVIRLGAPSLVRADSIDDAFKDVEATMDSAMTAVDQQWEAMVAAEEARWEALRAEVEAKWDSFAGSTKKEWVDYSPDREARSRVDYDKGQVVVEILVPAESVAVPEPAAPTPAVPRPVVPTPAVPTPAVPTPAVPTPALPTPALPTPALPTPALPAAVEARLEEQVIKLTQVEPKAPMGPVEGQVKTASGAPLAAANARDFVRNEVAPTVVVEPAIIKGKDGVERRKVRAVIPMVPEHLYVRAAKYKDMVTAEAEKVGLEPELLFAVIQTESYFNPRARSPAHAFGLMQLIPKYGALEAIEYLEGDKRIVEPEYLYVPENNVRLGATYLFLLHTRYYGKVEDPEKREVLSVASYNWGPTAVRRKIVEKIDVPALTVDEVRAAVAQRTPQETRDYVVRVSERKTLYQGLVAQ